MKKGIFSDPKYQGLAFFALGIGCFVLAGIVVFLFSGRFVDRPSGAKAGPALSITVPADRPSAPPEVSMPAQEPPEAKEWVLYITGGVASPGVYSLPPGSRVHNLVDAAGGLLPNADPVKVNLAAPLADGVHVHVPLAGEDGGKNDASASGAPPDSGFLRPPAIPGGNVGGAVRVNTASLEELQRIPGIGPTIARAILEYRAQKGKFSSLQDLLKVKGIGPKKLESIRNHVDLR
ncbi:ComEA family DNA-binding protein [Aminivibrio sp.]|uniref:ComEA family DNA-binding protein n=1 Tax=Aminivibrio sp. TaxID=1872489 RepID=UPI001A49182E|nr:ComEA family DNA-binding protein [Aminivibrio sp.]MBL3540361.1 ComEA family DNA-binding protein [Aminivibrio sp.]MDK2958930.1 competence protein ComEA [Synergistaceae bacterium]